MKIDFKDKDAFTCNVPLFKENDKYQPIDCGHYDYLEIWAMRQTPLLIQYSIDDNTSVSTVSHIKNISTKDSIEYLTTSSSMKLRLDQLISIETLSKSTID